VLERRGREAEEQEQKVTNEAQKASLLYQIFCVSTKSCVLMKVEGKNFPLYSLGDSNTKDFHFFSWQNISITIWELFSIKNILDIIIDYVMVD